MEINRNNYEAYLLDQMEGTLSREDQQRLRDFLTMNPDCAVLPNDFDPWVLDDKPLVYSDKEDLKRELPRYGSRLSDSNFDLFSIARMEGDLTPEQEMEHERALEHNPQKRSNWIAWQQIRLQSAHMEYGGKEKLKKRSGWSGRTIWWSVISAAAAVALVFTLLPMEPDLTETTVTEEIPAQRPLMKKTPSESEPVSAPLEEALMAVSDEPALFSIKKNPDRRLDTMEKGPLEETDQAADSIQLQAPRQIESRPVRLAAYEAYSDDLVLKSSYDQIKSLELPPAVIHQKSLSLALISGMDLQEAIDTYTEEKDISLLTLANAGIKGINKLTGSEISLMASRDEEGEVSGIRLKSKRFSFTRPIDRSEETAE
jgi:hypothetical protein